MITISIDTSNNKYHILIKIKSIINIMNTTTYGFYENTKCLIIYSQIPTIVMNLLYYQSSLLDTMALLTTSIITNVLNRNVILWYLVTIDKHEVAPTEANITVQYYKSEENKPPLTNE